MILCRQPQVDDKGYVSLLYFVANRRLAIRDTFPYYIIGGGGRQGRKPAKRQGAQNRRIKLGEKNNGIDETYQQIKYPYF